MADELRFCHGCGCEFPYTSMDKIIYDEWGKIIYFCKPCAAKKLEEEGTARIKSEKPGRTEHGNWYDNPNPEPFWKRKK